MFLLDDLLMFPLKGLHSLAKEIDERIRAEERENVASLRDRLTALYMELETGNITTEEFDRAELELVKQLEARQEMAGATKKRRAGSKAMKAPAVGGDSIADQPRAAGR